jgi:divalent metal cation (Fe/Co/Zn/Cd) transporter
VALGAFGGDSAIELLSATVVLTRFRLTHRITERLARKFTGWLLVLLAAYIATDSFYTLIAGESKPKPSYMGIGLLCSAAVVMPWLARRKRMLAAATNSSALRADAAQSSICAYLSWIALAGLALNAVLQFDTLRGRIQLQLSACFLSSSEKQRRAFRVARAIERSQVKVRGNHYLTLVAPSFSLTGACEQVHRLSSLAFC